MFNKNNNKYSPYKKSFPLQIFFFILLIVFFLFQNISNANSIENHNKEELSHEAWKGLDQETPIDDLRLYENGNFRVFYYTKGPNQVILTDNDKNDVPDYVEDVMKQLWASEHIFCTIIGFENPVGLKHYKDVETIDMYILKSDELKGANGIALDEPQQALLKPEGVKAIHIYLSKGFNFKSSSTVTHEYFHIIQNSQTKIKNLWYLEGLARWAEDALLDKNFNKNPRWNYYEIKKNKDILNHVQTLSYDAGKFFWIPFSFQFGKNTHLKLENKDPIYKVKYSDGTALFQDTKLAGAKLIKLFLENLHHIEKEIEKDYNFTEWTKQERLHKRNNPYVIKAIDKALQDHASLE